MQTEKQRRQEQLREEEELLNKELEAKAAVVEEHEYEYEESYGAPAEEAIDVPPCKTLTVNRGHQPKAFHVELATDVEGSHASEPILLWARFAEACDRAWLAGAGPPDAPQQPTWALEARKAITWKATEEGGAVLAMEVKSAPSGKAKVAQQRKAAAAPAGGGGAPIGNVQSPYFFQGKYLAAALDSAWPYAQQAPRVAAALAAERAVEAAAKAAAAEAAAAAAAAAAGGGAGEKRGGKKGGGRGGAKKGGGAGTLSVVEAGEGAADSGAPSAYRQGMHGDWLIPKEVFFVPGPYHSTFIIDKQMPFAELLFRVLSLLDCESPHFAFAPPAAAPQAPPRAPLDCPAQRLRPAADAAPAPTPTPTSPYPALAGLSSVFKLPPYSACALPRLLDALGAPHLLQLLPGSPPSSSPFAVYATVSAPCLVAAIFTSTPIPWLLQRAAAARAQVLALVQQPNPKARATEWDAAAREWLDTPQPAEACLLQGLSDRVLRDQLKLRGQRDEKEMGSLDHRSLLRLMRCALPNVAEDALCYLLAVSPNEYFVLGETRLTSYCTPKRPKPPGVTAAAAAAAAVEVAAAEVEAAAVAAPPPAPALASAAAAAAAAATPSLTARLLEKEDSEPPAVLLGGLSLGGLVAHFSSEEGIKKESSAGPFMRPRGVLHGPSPALLSVTASELVFPRWWTPEVLRAGYARMVADDHAVYGKLSRSQAAHNRRAAVFRAALRWAEFAAEGGGAAAFDAGQRSLFFPPLIPSLLRGLVYTMSSSMDQIVKDMQRERATAALFVQCSAGCTVGEEAQGEEGGAGQGGTCAALVGDLFAALVELVPGWARGGGGAGAISHPAALLPAAYSLLGLALGIPVDLGYRQEAEEAEHARAAAGGSAHLVPSLTSVRQWGAGGERGDWLPHSSPLQEEQAAADHAAKWDGVALELALRARAAQNAQPHLPYPQALQRVLEDTLLCRLGAEAVAQRAAAAGAGVGAGARTPRTPRAAEAGAGVAAADIAHMLPPGLWPCCGALRQPSPPPPPPPPALSTASSPPSLAAPRPSLPMGRPPASWQRQRAACARRWWGRQRPGAASCKSTPARPRR